MFIQTLNAQSSFSTDITNYHSLILSLDYTTNTNTTENINNEIRQPSLSPSLSLITSWGFDFLAAANFTDNSDDSLNNFASGLDLVLGYNIKPFKNLTIYPSYTRFLYSRNTHSLVTLFDHDVRVDIDFNYKKINSGLSAGYLMGSQHTFYSSFRNYYQVYISRFLSKKGILALQPGVDLNFGSYKYLSMYYLDQLSSSGGFYPYLLRHSSALRRYVLVEMYKNPGLTKEEIIKNYLEKKVDSTFKFTSVNFNLPVMILLGNFSINAAIFAIIPIGQPDYLSDDPQFFLSAGLSYIIDIKKK